MIESVVIRIDNFDNDAMADSPGTEVISILQKLIADIERQSFEDLDGVRLLDSNGNRVGVVSVNTIDEDDIDDEGDDEDFDDLDDE